MVHKVTMWPTIVLICVSLSAVQAKCAKENDCGECIQMIDCAFCINQTTTFEAGCINRHHYEKKCLSVNLINPQPKLQILTDNEETRKEETLFFKPQEIKLNLRRGMSYNVSFRVLKKSMSQLDLYMLLDLSKTLTSKHMDELLNLENELPKAMKRNGIDKVCTLGFGSFVEKPVSPFTNTVHENNPCLVADPCLAAYVFKNHLSLSEDLSQFTEAVKRTNTSGNNDHLEAGLEALQQVMVCGAQLGWRPHAIHLIMLLTDGGFHVAGDGKLAGITTPNDGRCHLVDGQYTHALLQDYPSVGQINRTAINHKMQIIFAVPDDQKELYDMLSSHVRPSHVRLLSQDASDINNLIIHSYKQADETVKLFTDNLGDVVEVKFYSRCGGDTMRETNECRNVTGDRNELEFVAQVRALKCAKDGGGSDVAVRVYAEGHSAELSLLVSPYCTCPHQPPHVYEKNSSKCGFEGDLAWGRCECVPGRYGSWCQCQERHTFKYEYDCRAGGTGGDLCSGRGECDCGVCRCLGGAYGRYCECTDDNCLDGCSGHGACRCGLCECHTGWTGDNCNCTEAVESCSERGAAPCSGHGDCRCGQCFCHDDYSGPLCQVSLVDQHDALCRQLAVCVQCFVDHDQSCNHTCHYNISYRQHLDDFKCKHLSTDNCLLEFSYHQDKNSINVVKKACHEATTVNIAFMSIGVIVATVILGLIIIAIFMMIKKYKEKIEYQKFELERDNTRYDNAQNPLYRDPNTQFQNPLFTGTR